MRLPRINEIYVLASQGPHSATLVGFTHYGTQKSDFKGTERQREVVGLRWELSDGRMDDGRPCTVSRTYTWSMHEKSALRRDLESWRGRPFTNKDLGPDGFDTKSLIGKKCLLNIVHEIGANGSTYANVASIMPLPKGMPEPDEPQSDFVYFALTREEFDEEVFRKLPEKMQETIKSSPEYQSLKAGERSGKDKARAFANVTSAPQQDQDEDDPF